MFETNVTVVGRVITDLNQRTVPNGDRVCGFRMVATERRFNRESQEWVDGDHLFLQVTCWRKLADNVAASLVKGDSVVVNGRLYLNEYEVNGTPRSVIELDARAVGPNLAMCTASVNRPSRAAASSEQPVTPGAVAA